jgi:hypothetical protein
MLSDEQPAVIVSVKNGQRLPEKPKVRWYHWVNYYWFNLKRKPKVWQAQKKLKSISDSIYFALERDVYPVLEKRMSQCEMCADGYAALRPQIFLSQIELILKRVKCSSHPHIFANFLEIQEPKFRESEKIAAWINGFGG